VSHVIVVFILDITICSIQLGLMGCFGHLKVDGSLGWRSAFWIESLLMLPFAIFGFMSKRIHLKGSLEKTAVEQSTDGEVSAAPTDGQFSC
jgi:hypothetical protein